MSKIKTFSFDSRGLTKLWQFRNYSHFHMHLPILQSLNIMEQICRITNRSTAFNTWMKVFWSQTFWSLASMDMTNYPKHVFKNVCKFIKNRELESVTYKSIPSVSCGSKWFSGSPHVRMKNKTKGPKNSWWNCGNFSSESTYQITVSKNFLSFVF